MSSNNSDNFIQAYHNLNMALIRTLVIKSNFAPDAINKQIKADHGADAINIYDKASWKYYMNIAGEYHTLDKPMYVISLDSRQQILFSKENLVRHTATAEAYQMGSRYYLALLSEYPEQEALINGILYPADKATAIAAPEGTILAYQTSLVEEGEETLIIELELYLKRFFARWYVSAYALTDAYYPAFFFFSLGGMALLELLRLRNDRRKTTEVHSFHLRQYLASHNGLDQYLDFLERDQALYLYRNIRYIRRNGGNTFMFQELIKELLEKRGIPLDDYTVRQLQEETETGYPVVRARRVPLNSISAAKQDPYIAIETMYSKEGKTARGNVAFYRGNEDAVTHMLSTSNSSALQTKNMESSMVDLTDTVPDTLPDVFMRQWIFMTHAGLYNVAVNFQDPVTAEDRSLMSKDAIKYMAYLTFKSEGFEFLDGKLPPIENMKFRRHPRPLVADLHALIPDGFEYDYLREMAYTLVSNQPILEECFSVKMFYDMTYKIYDECLGHYFAMGSCGDPMHRSVLELMVAHLFSVAYWDFSDNENIEDWRERNNLPPYDYSPETAAQIIKVVFERATGYTVDETRQLRYVQKALIDLFSSVESYSVQVIREINDTPLIMVGTPQERIGMLPDEGDETSLDLREGEFVLENRDWSTDNVQVTEHGSEDYIDIVQDPSSSELMMVSTVEQVAFTEDDETLNVIARGDMIEGISTMSYDPVNGQWVEDSPESILELVMAPDLAFKFSKFLESK